MERKWLITIVIIAIIIVGGLGWYFLIWSAPREQQQVLKVYMDNKNYTTPLTWNLTATPGSMVYSSLHNITNLGNSSVNVAFTLNVYHHNGTHWIEEFNGTHWKVTPHYANARFVSAANVTKFWTIWWANKSHEQATYYFSFAHTDQMVYVTFWYQGENPTVDGTTVFTCICFDGNGNNLLDASDKAFNFTNNPNRQYKNQLKIYKPRTTSSWNSSATEYSWNETLPIDIPVTVAISDNRKNITLAIPFNYIGAEKAKPLGFAVQAFSRDWGPAGADSTTPSRYQKVQLDLALLSTFVLGPERTTWFYIGAEFTSGASGEYSFILKTTVRET